MSSYAQWIAYLLLDLAALSSDHCPEVFFRKILDVAKLIYHSVRVDRAKKQKIVDQTHPVLAVASGKLELRKQFYSL